MSPIRPCLHPVSTPAQTHVSMRDWEGAADALSEGRVRIIEADLSGVPEGWGRGACLSWLAEFGCGVSFFHMWRFSVERVVCDGG
jgi:hypothetical protein